MDTGIKGSFENSEVLIRHSELILANLEKVEHDFREDGKILTKVKGSALSQLKKFIAEYEQAAQKNDKLPNASGSVSASIESLANELVSSKTIFLVDYACHWLRAAQLQLQLIYENSREFDIRWNLPVSLRTCKIFAAFCKISLFLHYIKNSSLLVTSFSISNAAKNQKLLNPLNELVATVKACSDNPFTYIATKNDKLKVNLSSLIFHILPFFSQLFADWPIFNWSLLSFYEFAPEDTVGNSMPIDELTLLANIALFQETMTFFLMAYPSYMDLNPQFTYLASGLVSESAFVYLSRNFSIKTGEMINLSLSSHANKDNTTLPFLRDNFEKTIELKNKSTHLHRMQQLYYLAEDLENFAEIDFNQFLRCIHQVRAICAFSYYEIELFFRIKDQKLWNKQNVIAVMKLFALVDNITEYFVREKFTVERFFVYNLSTTDAQFLQTIINKFDSKQLGKSGGGNILDAATYIQKAIQNIDLNEFDQGVHYDFYPLILTHGRILHDYNKIANNLHITYLNSLFEHLGTIADHCYTAMDATRYFLEFCPIHTFWRHHMIFSNFLKCEHMPMDTSIVFLHVFSYFNYDNIILPCLNMIESLKSQLQSIKALLSQQIRAIMGKIASVKKELIGNPGNKLQSDYENNPNKNLLNSEFVHKRAEQLSALTKAKQFVASIPESIFFYGTQVEIASFFINSFQNDFIRVLLFKLHDNTHAIIDASEFLWSLMGKIGIDFKQALFNGIISETMFASPDIKEQVKCFTNPSLPKCPKGAVDEQRIVHKFSNELIEFIGGGHKKTKYVQLTQQFFALTSQESKSREELIIKPKNSDGSVTSDPGAILLPGANAAAVLSKKESNTMGMGFGFGNELDGSLCFSTQHFVDLFRTLGIHCAVYLDCSVIMSIINNIFTIIEDGYQNFSKILSGNQNLTDNIINSPEIAKASEALLSVSVGLTIQSMIRRATKIVIDEVYPKLSRIASSNIDSKQKVTDELMLIKEITSTEHSFYFIKKFMEGADKCSADLTNYFMYIAAMVLNINWKGVAFYPDYDALWQNYQLIPYAFQLLVELAPLVFDKASPENIRAGINSFFYFLSSNQPKLTKGQNYNSFYILVDKFMKYVPEIDYGEIEEFFPYTLLSSGYPSTVKASS